MIISNKILQVEFSNFLTEEQFKHKVDSVLSACKEHKITKIVADTSSSKVFKQENLNYIQNVFFPMAEDAGVKFLAFIQSKSTLAKMGSKRANDTNTSVTIANFPPNEKEAAIKWIKSKH